MQDSCADLAIDETTAQEVEGVPGNHFQPAFVSIVERKCSRMNLLTPATAAALLDSTMRLIVQRERTPPGLAFVG
jgi:hypothetical protein